MSVLGVRPERSGTLIVVGSSSFAFSASFPIMLHTRYVKKVHLYQMAVNFRRGNIFQGKKTKRIIARPFPLFSSLRINLA
jgi:phosphopentomutase